MERSRSRRAASVPAVLALLALLAGACSGRDRSQGKGRATGPPLVVGLVTMENAPVGSFPEFRQGAEAAAAYVNDELGGVRGRRLELRACATTGTPESSRSCANELVPRRPVAVLGGIDLGANHSLPILQRAGIPYVGGAATVISELTSPTSFMLTAGPPSEVLGLATYALDRLKVKSVGVIYPDLPGLLSDATELVEVVLRKKEVTDVELVPQKPDGADVTPALTKATSGRPDAVLVALPAQGCARVMQARQALGVRSRMFYLGACAEQGVLQAGGGGADQAYFASGYLPYTDTSDRDVAVYRERVRSARQQPSLLSQTGFSLVMNLHDVLGEIEGQVTAAATASKLQGARGRRSFMGHPYSCDGQQVPLLASVCDAHVRILQNRDGKLVDVVGDWVNGAELVNEL